MESKDLIIQWLAEQCAEKLGCWDVNGAHPCGEDCIDCWIRRAVKEVENEGRSGTDRA